MRISIQPRPRARRPLFLSWPRIRETFSRVPPASSANSAWVTGRISRLPLARSHSLASRRDSSEAYFTASSSSDSFRTTECPSLPRAPLLRRHYPPSSLIWAHARVLRPLSSFDLRSALESLCRLGQPRLVHRTVPALTSGLSKSVAPPTPRVRPVHLTVSSRATAAFTARVAARQPLAVPQHGFMRGEFTALQAFLYVATLSFARPSDRSHGVTRGKDFVVRASMDVVTDLHAGPATRLNRSIVATDLSSARTDVLLAARSWNHDLVRGIGS
jgi:hypothetical protein